MIILYSVFNFTVLQIRDGSRILTSSLRNATTRLHLDALMTYISECFRRLITKMTPSLWIVDTLSIDIIFQKTIQANVIKSDA